MGAPLPHTATTPITGKPHRAVEGRQGGLGLLEPFQQLG